MAKSRTKKQSGKSQASLSLLPTPKGVLWIVIVVIAIAAIIFFFGHAIFEGIGFGLFIGALWLVAIAYVVWRQGLGSLLKWWNLWLGAIVFTLALWGIFALFRPTGLAIANADFSQVSLGGNAGRSFIGSQGVGAPPAVRLVILFLVGIGLVIPRPSLRALQLLSRATKSAGLITLAGIRWFLPRLRQVLTKLNQRYHLSKLLAAPIVALRKRLSRRRAAEPEIGGEEAGEVVALSPDTEAAEDKAAPEATGDGEQLLLPIAGAKKKKPATAEPKGAVPQSAITPKQQLPPIELLDKATDTEFTEVGNDQKAKLIEEALRSYGVEAKVIQINPGPSVTQFGIEPGWDRKYKRVIERDREGKAKLDRDGNPIERLEEISKTRVKVERITALGNNLALALATPNIRIEAPVPGKSLVGVEVPNTTTSIVRLRAVPQAEPAPVCGFPDSGCSPDLYAISVILHPAGSHALAAASLGFRFGSQREAFKRWPLIPSAASEISQSSGGTMISGASKFVRSSAGTSAGIMPVRLAPPGSRALTVTPVRARSWAHMIVSDSSAAFEGPYGENPRRRMVW